MSKFAAIVLSAGCGKRMKSEVPKQYLMLKDKPVIYYSLKAFEESSVSDIVLVVGGNDAEYCRREIIDKYQIKKVKAIVPGGKERYDSVFEGLKAIGEADYVLIHDGARPMLTQDIIARSMETVITEQACVVGMPVKDTVKIADGNRYAVHTPDRTALWMVQTPQTFSYPLIKEAYERLFALQQMGESLPAITDDAMVVEYIMKRNVKLVEGSYENLKITTPEDLLIAELFLKTK